MKKIILSLVVFGILVSPVFADTASSTPTKADLIIQLQQEIQTLLTQLISALQAELQTQTTAINNQSVQINALTTAVQNSQTVSPSMPSTPNTPSTPPTQPTNTMQTITLVQNCSSTTDPVYDFQSNGQYVSEYLQGTVTDPDGQLSTLGSEGRYGTTQAQSINLPIGTSVQYTFTVYDSYPIMNGVKIAANVLGIATGTQVIQACQ